MVLEGAGYDVRDAANGAEALAQLADEPPDCVLIDLRLGDMSGLDVLRAARERVPMPKAIVITAHGDVDSAVQRAPSGRLRFHPQAVRRGGGARLGQERAPHRPARAAGGVLERAASRAALRESGHARGDGATGAGGAPADARGSHPGRDGNRQGARGSLRAPPLRALEGALHRAQLLGHPRIARRERALRSRARRVLRRARAEAWTRRAGRRRDAVPGRDRRSPGSRAGEAAAVRRDLASSAASAARGCSAWTAASSPPPIRRSRAPTRFAATCTTGSPG